MRNIFYRGENILVRWSLVDNNNAPIAFSSLDSVTVVVKDNQGNAQSFTKAGNTVKAVVGGAANQFEFEVTEAMSSAFASGDLIARFTYRIPSGDHASGFLTDIVEEGVTSKFITLQ